MDAKNIEKIEISGAFKSAWENFKNNAGLLVGATAGMFVISLLFSGLQNMFEPGGILDAAVQILNFVVMCGYTAGFLKVLLDIERTDNSDFSRLFDLERSLFWKYLGFSFLFSIIGLFAFMLLVVPGVIFALFFCMGYLLVVDKHLSPIDAFKESAAMTEGHKWNLFLFGLGALLLNVVGLLALGIGLLVTVPVTMGAFTHIYVKLLK